jgi:hypothetical protein
VVLGYGEKNMATTYFCSSYRAAIIGANLFHGRVRNGNVCYQVAMITNGTAGQLLELWGSRAIDGLSLWGLWAFESFACVREAKLCWRANNCTGTR